MPLTFLLSFRHALRGIAAVWREERNFQIQVCVAALLCIAMVVLQFTYTEAATVLIAIILVLTMEILNTFAEDLLNFVEPGHHTAVGKLKDIIAGMVLLTSVGAVVLGVLTVMHYLQRIFPLP